MKYHSDKYNKMSSNSISSNLTESDVDTKSITNVLRELGIRHSADNEYKLILWNDHVNNMIDVVVALYEICKLSNEKCAEVMLEAHEKGRAVVKSGDFDELNDMKIELNDRNIEATIE